MKGKLVSLSLHKTNRQRRRAKCVCKDIGRLVHEAQGEFGTDIAGYALVIWTEEGEALADWLNSAPLKGYPVEDFARHMLSRTKNIYDAQRVLLDD